MANVAYNYLKILHSGLINNNAFQALIRDRIFRSYRGQRTQEDWLNNEFSYATRWIHDEEGAQEIARLTGLTVWLRKSGEGPDRDWIQSFSPDGASPERPCRYGFDAIAFTLADSIEIPYNWPNIIEKRDTYYYLPISGSYEAKSDGTRSIEADPEKFKQTRWGGYDSKRGPLAIAPETANAFLQELGFIYSELIFYWKGRIARIVGAHDQTYYDHYPWASHEHNSTDFPPVAQVFIGEYWDNCVDSMYLQALK